LENQTERITVGFDSTPLLSSIFQFFTGFQSQVGASVFFRSRLTSLLFSGLSMGYSASTYSAALQYFCRSGSTSFAPIQPLQVLTS
jgi:hypothetical protein